MSEFTHFNKEARPRMVNVTEKNETKRTAIAHATVLVNKDTLELIKEGSLKKGDVLSTADIAGVMGAKSTSSLIPMCHNINLTGVDLSFKTIDSPPSIEITSTVVCVGKTGVEMEALTSVSVAALTIYDMCKAVQRDIEITDIYLIEKDGGASGRFINKRS